VCACVFVGVCVCVCGWVCIPGELLTLPSSIRYAGLFFLFTVSPVYIGVGRVCESVSLRKIESVLFAVRATSDGVCESVSLRKPIYNIN